MKKEIIDIHSKGDYPSCALSNFAEYGFCVDGIKCSSMEGFLQSLKFRSEEKQRQVCTLSGINAKNSTRCTFAQFRWKLTHKLYWQGKQICRFSDEYQNLIDKAYGELAKNAEFRKALASSADSRLVHSIGKSDVRKTVLTEYEFVSRLTRIRDIYTKQPNRTHK